MYHATPTCQVIGFLSSHSELKATVLRFSRLQQICKRVESVRLSHACVVEPLVQLNSLALPTQ